MKITQKYKEKYARLMKYRHSICRLSEDADFHRHHVLPKFLKPKRNIVVKLTPKEHCIALHTITCGRARQKSESEKTIRYLYTAYKGLSIAFGNDNCKIERMKQFMNDLEQEICQ